MVCRMLQFEEERLPNLTSFFHDLSRHPGKR